MCPVVSACESNCFGDGSEDVLPSRYLWAQDTLLLLFRKSQSLANRFKLKQTGVIVIYMYGETKARAAWVRSPVAGWVPRDGEDATAGTLFGNNDTF